MKINDPKTAKKGFTLVELLVVIGIIALLISILLPSLNKARRSAATIKCSSNMRQITAAVLQYIQANKGKHPPSSILRKSGSGVPPSRVSYPDGWGWANELVHQGYIKGPNNRPKGKTEFYGDSVFRCPEGLDVEFATGSTSDSNAWPGATWPTNISNNAYAVVNSDTTRVDGQDTYATFTWYQLNARTQSGSPSQSDMTYVSGSGQGGTKFCPFTQFVSTATEADITGKAFARNISMVKKSSLLLMIVEAADPGWTQEGGDFTGGDGKTWYLRRVGARHGKKDGPYNAYLNVSYFDGHVETVSSKKFLYVDPQKMTESTGMVLYLNKQW